MIENTLESNDVVNQKRVYDESLPSGVKNRKEGKRSEAEKRRMNGESYLGYRREQKK